MNPDLLSLIHFIRTHNAVFALGLNNIAKELLSFCFDNGLKIDAFIQYENTPVGTNFFGVPVLGASSNIPTVQNCGFVIAVGDKDTKNALFALQRSGLYDSFILTEAMAGEITRLALSKNAELRNSAESERCFLLCTGPSVLQQDLTKLKNETVFSCSYTPEFETYNEIAPKYYITPSALNDMEDTEYIIECLRYFNERVSSSIMIGDYNDKIYAQQYGFLKNKNMFWIMQNTAWQPGRREVYDLTGSTPIIWTASVMMLKIVIYMGYKKIYLLGTDHGGGNSPTYDHAYKTDNLPPRLKKVIVSDNDVKDPKYLRFYRSWQIFEEYFHLHQTAKANGIEIYNAAPGSGLDEFPMVEYESLF